MAVKDSKSDSRDRIPLEECKHLARNSGHADVSETSEDVRSSRPQKRRNIKEDNSEVSEERAPLIGYFSLFRYTSALERVLITLACITAVVSGIFGPIVLIVYGIVIDKMIVFSRQTEIRNCSHNFTVNCAELKDVFLGEVSNLCLWMTSAGVCRTVFSYLTVVILSLVASNQAYKIRCKFMASVLKQEMGWFDVNQTGVFANKITSDLIRIQDGMGEKLGICLSCISKAIMGIICGLYFGWQLTLVLLAVAPIPLFGMAILARIQAAATREEVEAYSTAGYIAEEVLSAIRTVVAFGGERKEIERYGSNLDPAKKKGIKKGMITAFAGAIFWSSWFVCYAVGFWYGIHLVLRDWDKMNPQYTGGTIVNILENVLYAVSYLGATPAFFEAFALSRSAASQLFEIIDRKPLIDSSSDSGTKPSSINGNINFKEVHFTYPARPTVPVLNGVSLNVEPGETVALVGPSGCGKSTIIQLILRFYDADRGIISLDRNSVKSLNIGWLRDNISLVGQEPVLFSTTIEDNIRHGKPDASFEEVQNAAKLAYVHEFISSLPLKYQTLVGERGTQLSGGQKQRVAIARAIIKNPKILLLDEATSALDTEGETVVQAALEKASLGRTTIVVAHRLSTIRNVDRIVVLADGRVEEVGTHNELMKKGGTYHSLVLAQVKKGDEVVTNLRDEEENFELQTATLSSGLNNKIDDFRNRSVQTNAPTEIDDENDKKASPSQISLLKLSAQEWPFITVGSVSAIITGIYFVLSGILFGNVTGLLEKDRDEVEKKYPFACIIFLVIGVTCFLFNFLQVFMFSIAGERLTCRLRKMVFANIITQDIAFFDQIKNSVGRLCSRLTSDASDVQGAAGVRISTLLQCISTMFVAVVISFYFNYKLAFVVLPCTPIILLTSYFNNLSLSGWMKEEKSSTEAATQVAAEAIGNMRTVASLHEEETFYREFKNSAYNINKKFRIKCHTRGLTYSIGVSVEILFSAALLYYGAQLVADGSLHFADLIKVTEGVLIGLMVVGQGLAFAPEYQKGKLAATRILKLLELKPRIDAFSNGGCILNSIKGNIRFEAVHFNYPSRPDVSVLKGLNLEIESGKTVAIVGSSGCGKSTCIQLIERFYDVDCGRVVVDGMNVEEINVANLRSHLGLVSQEPVLFSCSIGENIAYGDNTRTPDHTEVISAARKANIHNFIITLPQGYDTPVGNRGTHLSGGQKQRVAIARALLRNPELLLLDEATSALDSESEKVVQTALEEARKGRTCLVIAHKLSTIQNADTIIVMHNGRIAEKGTHQELLRNKGHYYNLQNIQDSPN